MDDAPDPEVPSLDALWEVLSPLIGPLTDAGWEVMQESPEVSWEFGNSVTYELERLGAAINVEYYDVGELVAYDVDPDYDPERDEPSEPLFTIPSPTVEVAVEWYRRQGWI